MFQTRPTPKIRKPLLKRLFYLLNVTGKRTKSSRIGDFDWYALSSLKELIRGEWSEKKIAYGAVDWIAKVKKKDIIYYLDIVQSKHRGIMSILGNLKDQASELEEDTYYRLVGEES